ncbi:Lipopolysaccharide biosynthesis protein, LPS:glycosyltransferase [Bosea sp. OK403]|uniref:glycosyltransferase family 8 protein n=1 Tax=Bosea sp. OK403 TaxID=1855286 RepID=UPI0008DEE82C|nr:glycosyltransferase family 8 protein [Bosea sp. OK403]SFJ56570.1 Lipopolysaccharide biosynthesis protein, LPS:glycosyltransferase [Bosea sp. OK403]
MAKTEDIHLLCASNINYIMPLTVMLTSVVFNYNSDRVLHIYVLTSDIEVDAQTEIERVIGGIAHKNVRIIFHWSIVDLSLFETFFSQDGLEYMSPDTYSRLLAPRVLPADCEQVIYLDCDLVVLTDLALLNDAANPQFAVSAVSNVWYPYVSSISGSDPIVFNYAELGIPASNRYFQCGVLVINLKRWRERNVSERAFHYLAEHKHRVKFHDQGALNAVLFDDWFRLDQRWNQVSTALHSERWVAPAYSHAEWVSSKNHPFIVHYDGKDKPWNADFKRPRSSFFTRYLRMTPYSRRVDLSPATRLESAIGYRAYYALWRLKRGAVDLLQTALRPG